MFPKYEFTNKELAILCKKISEGMHESHNPEIVDTIGSADIRALKYIRNKIKDWIKETEAYDNFY